MTDRFHSLFGLVLERSKDWARKVVDRRNVRRTYKTPKAMPTLERVLDELPDSPYGADPAVREALARPNEWIVLALGLLPPETYKRIDGWQSVRFYSIRSDESTQPSKDTMPVGKANFLYPPNAEKLIRLISSCDLVLADRSYFDSALAIGSALGVPVLQADRNASLPDQLEKEFLGTLQRRQRRFYSPNGTQKPQIKRTPSTGPSKLLAVGNDFRFIQAFLDWYQENGVEVGYSRWDGHAGKPPSESLALIQQADVVFCEWGLGNAVWASHNVLEAQRLVVRIHSQEFRTDFLRNLRTDRVDQFIFVSPHMLERGVRVFNLPRERCTWIPNYISPEFFRVTHTNHNSPSLHIALVGALPAMKGLDRALRIVGQLNDLGTDTTLHIFSRHPHELEWLMARQSERAFYNTQFDTIRNLNEHKANRVIWHGHADPLAASLAGMDYVLSLSEFEGFHLAIAEGAAAGVEPVILRWLGSESLYPQEFIFDSEYEIVAHLRNNAPRRAQSRSFARRYSTTEIFPLIHGAISPQ